MKGSVRVTARKAGAGRLKALLRCVAHRVAAGIGAVALTAALLAATGQVAAADPPLTVEEAKSQIAELETEAAALDQEYVKVKEKLDQGKARLKVKKADLIAQTRKVARMRQQVGQVALAKFQNRNLDTAAQLFFTEDTDGFLSQISTVEKVSENQNATLQDFQSEQAVLRELERSNAADLAALETQEKTLTKLRSASDRKIAESKDVLAKLTEEERRRIAEEERRARAAAQRAAEEDASAAQQPGEESADGSAEQSAATTSSGEGGSGRGATALAFAKTQIGKPYRFASAGPDAYDCSGLTSAAWKTAGVTLPRSSYTQFNAGRAVDRSELQPGDLVFFYSDLSHVALYAGNGMVVQSPRPGRTVEYAQMSSMPYAGARRPA